MHKLTARRGSRRLQRSSRKSHRGSRRRNLEDLTRLAKPHTLRPSLVLWVSLPNHLHLATCRLLLCSLRSSWKFYPEWLKARPVRVRKIVCVLFVAEVICLSFCLMLRSESTRKTVNMKVERFDPACFTAPCQLPILT